MESIEKRVRAVLLGGALLAFESLALAQPVPDVAGDGRSVPLQGYTPPAAYSPYWYAAPPVPATLPYVEGQPVPSGYRVQRSTRRGLFIAGAIALGVPWAFGVSIGSLCDYSNKSGWLIVPAVGPWLTLATRNNRADGWFHGEVLTILFLDGMAQAAGLTMMIAGVAFPRTQLVHTGFATVQIAPVLGPERAGLAALGSF